MKTTEATIAAQLLQIKAIKLQPANPFTWASGWLSPIYCDNRKTLSYPEVRTFIRDGFAELIREKFAGADVIAGVATGAIAQGALVADVLGKPFVYIRSSPKGHGLENLIEGDLKPGQKVVVVEDLISTGGSSLKAVQAVRDFGGEVMGMVAIFTYGFSVAAENFAKEGVELHTLSNYQTLINVAVETGYVSSDDLDALDAWRQNPAQWNK
ncbi:orotate phosphoribosyltransferase [Alkaliflexus imshenetskii]|uniref:orotate phosphoribosyltransferase n=1 Tax=Alkaliflexus imshenetskii TaxID=286730 RepID=UPI00047C8E50|nr:orotate phosphoribosyltransferase [Alkaliflexus imshenetskii]